MKKAYADTPEGQIHYRAEGSGKSLLLLHKASLSSDEYTELLPLLSKNHRTISVDALGCGESDQPLFVPAIEDYARNIIHFMDALKIAKTDFVGRLFGASIGVEMAVSYPERINKLVLLDLLHVEPAVLKRAHDDFINETVVFEEDGSHLIEVWNGRRAKPPVKMEMAQRATNAYLASDLGRRAGDSHRAKFAYDVGTRLSKIKQPVFLLYSERSGLFPNLESTRKLIPECPAKLIAGTPSFPTWEKPQEYAQAITEFLEKPV